MVDRYAFARRRVDRAIRRWSTGTVTLTRETPAADDPTKPWLQGEPTLDVYALDARVDGVLADYIDGTTVVASDEMAIASPKARHTLHDGEAADGAVVEIEPRMSDTLQVDGEERAVKAIRAIPAAGPAAMFHIIIAA
jgi:hypothetical protein